MARAKKNRNVSSIVLGGCENLSLNLADHESIVQAPARPPPAKSKASSRRPPTKKAKQRSADAPASASTSASKSATTPVSARPTAPSWSAEAVQSLDANLSEEHASEHRQLTASRRVAAIQKENDDWHVIPERNLTPEQARDLRLIENRAQLDGKRFYKSSGTGRRRGELPSRVHFGTIQVGAHEFFSSRLTRRQRRSTFIDEVLADDTTVSKTRDRFKRLVVKRKISKRVVDPAANRRRGRK